MSEENHQYSRLTDRPQEPTNCPPGVTSQTPMATSLLSPESMNPAGCTTTVPPQTQTVIVQLQPRKSRKLPQYNHRLSKILAITQLVAGALAIVMNSLGLASNVRHGFSYYGETYESGYDEGRNYYFRGTVAYSSATGIWCPVLFVSLSAAFGLASAYKKTRCLVITHLVLSIIASLFVFMMLGFAVGALGQDIERMQNGFKFSHNVFVPYTSTSSPGGISTTSGYRYNSGRDNGFYKEETLYSGYAHKLSKRILAVSCFWVLVSLVEFVSCVWASTLCCKAYCCNKIPNEDPVNAADSVRYTAPPQTEGSHLLVVDHHGRPIPGAQIVQIPGSSTALQGPQTTGEPHYPTKSGMIHQHDGDAQTRETDVSLLPPPYVP